MEETAKIGEPGAHDNSLTFDVVSFILLNKGSDIFLGGDHDIVVAVVLHDFEDLYLMRPQAPSVAVNQVSKEIKQLALIVAILWFFLYVLAYFLDQVKHLDLIVEHSLVIIVHLLQKIDTADISLNVMDHFGNVPLHLSLYLVEVFNQGDDEKVAHVK